MNAQACTERVSKQPPQIKALCVRVTRGQDVGLQAIADAETISIGTASDNSLVLTDPTVSRYHMELCQTMGDLIVTDLGSTNGTRIGNVFVEKARLQPGTSVDLGHSAIQILDGDTLSLDAHTEESFHGILGRSQAMRRLMKRVERIAKSDVSVLLRGETGVGKEVVAHAVHRASLRSAHPFEIVDCAALVPSLVASELFGHEPGAFTGAESKRIGAFERAEGGTLFLDEIGDLPSDLQVALLGVLERRSIRRVGGAETIRVDVRVLAATHRDLRGAVNNRSFREDLYYRLAVTHIDIPRLRERVEDIPILIEHFLRESGHNGPMEEVVSPDALARMASHSWPGNVRELRNAVDSLLALGEEGAWTLSPPSAAPDGERIPLLELARGTYKDGRAQVLREFEAYYLRALLERTRGNVSEASRVGQVSRRYLIDLIRRHNLN